ncbi:MAG: helix-turn-helix transcriptional regulator [Actinobacteria bacterium]|nr:helix-turn-helix transcriptional regulator [Actinomycetota bacterium]
MCDDKNNNISKCSCMGGRSSRYLVPALLLLLAEKSSHGYELTERYSDLGFTYANFDPGAIYRTLRLLESENLIKSKWETDDIGPAKKIYSITPEGLEMLSSWIADIEKRKNIFENFLQRFKNLKSF